eukprot:gene5422-3907_t
MADQMEAEQNMDPQVAAILRSLTPEEIDMLRDAFIFLDRDSDGFISLEELLEGVREMVSEERYAPLQEYLAPLFRVADKDRDDKLSLTEFLMSFGDGPGVVPADVVNSCVATVRVRLSDEEVSTLQDNFRSFDKDEDGFLNREELEDALRTAICDKFPDLTSANFDEIIAVVLKSADRNGDGKLSLSEFIRSYQEDQGVLPAAFVDVGVTKAVREISAEELNTLREAFVVLDKNNDGYIDVADLYQALWEMLGSQGPDKSQITDLCDMIVTTAGRGKSGNLSLDDFVQGFLKNMEILEIPLIAVKAALHDAGSSLQTMLEEGKLDHLIVAMEGMTVDKNGYIDYENMIGLLTELYKDAFPEWDDEVLTNVMTAIAYGAETRNSGRLSLDDFIRSFVEGPGMINLDVTGTLSSLDGSTGRPFTATNDDLTRISEALRALSDETDDDGCITLENLRAAIFEAFPESEEGAQRRLEYVLSNFVNQLDDGRLGWNENVQIVEEKTSGAEEAKASEQQQHELEKQQERERQLELERQQALLREKELQEKQKKEEEAAAAARAKDEAGTERTPAGHPEVNISQVELAEMRSKHDSPKNDAAPPPAPKQAPAPAPAPVAAPAPAPAPVQRHQVPMPSLGDLESRVRGKPSVAHNFALARASRSKDINLHSGRGNLVMSRDAIYENELRELFSLYDTTRCGYLDREEFKKVYLNMEHYGLEPTNSEIDALFKRYSHGSNKLYFNEFCVLMLQRLPGDSASCIRDPLELLTLKNVSEQLMSTQYMFLARCGERRNPIHNENSASMTGL